MLGGLTHLGAGALLAAVAGGVAHGGGGQRVGVVETLAQVIHALQQVLQVLGKVRLAGGQVAQLGFLLGREQIGRLADQIRFGGRLRGLLHRLFLLLEQSLSVLDHRAVGLELAQALEHLLEFVGNGFLVGLGLGQGSSHNLLGFCLRLVFRLSFGSGLTWLLASGFAFWRAVCRPGLGLILGLCGRRPLASILTRWLGRRLILAPLTRWLGSA